MAASGGHTAALRSAPAGVSSPQRPDVALCSLLVLNSSAKRRGCSAGLLRHQKGTQRRGPANSNATRGATERPFAATGVILGASLSPSPVSKLLRSGRQQSLVRATSAESSQGSTGGGPQEQPGEGGSGSGSEGPQKQRDAAREALRALDQQLADLAGEPPPRPPRVGDAALRVTDSSTAKKPPALGPDSSPEEWPEFDASFFTYSSLILLVLTAVVNWGFSALGPKEDQRDPGVIAAKQVKRARMDALVLQVLGDDPPPESERRAPEVKVGGDVPEKGGL